MAPPRIAIPMPHSTDREYGDRAIPQYERAVAMAGGEPVRVALDRTDAAVMELIERCDGVLLPGSNADVDPMRFHQSRSPTPPKPIRAVMKSTTFCSKMPMCDANPCSASVTVCRVSTCFARDR